MVSFSQQLHTLSRECALRITKMLTAKHSFSITEIYGDLSKSPAEVKQRNIMDTNGWTLKDGLDGLAAREAQGNPDNMTPEQAGMSKGRCPI